MTRCNRGWLLSLALAVGAALALGPASQADDKPATENPAVKPEPRTGQQGPAKRHTLILERSRREPAEVVFLGDSITQGWEGPGSKVWQEHFAPLKASNFGIGGDRTQHVLWRITEGKELDGIHPKLAVVMIGTNNTGSNSAEQIADGIKAIVSTLREKEPAMKILLLGVFPRGEKPDTDVRKKIKGINERIAKLDDGKHVFYQDIGDKFVSSDGSIDKKIMPDFLHLSQEG